MTEALRVDKLTKRHGDFIAVDGVSFTLGQGEILGLLGANGAGKSTLMRMLCNLARPTSGQAWLLGQPVMGTRAGDHRRRLGAVIEAPRFHPQLSGRKNLSMLARLHGVTMERVQEMPAVVGLTERAEERFGRYSMGMKQRLGLAAAFLHQPAVILLDEPTSGLDPVGREQIHGLIQSLAQRQPVSILLCSHDLDEVEKLCHRALVMHRGRVILDHSLRAPGGIAVVERAFRELALGTPSAGEGA